MRRCRSASKRGLAVGASTEVRGSNCGRSGQSTSQRGRHRDLKPGNIMLTTSGAKLLDFGLAKPTAPLSSAETLTAATLNSPVTEQGTIVGTFQYMSPEQIEGKELDGRSDLFSLGAVLYEMLTGQRAFPGKSPVSVASAILEKEPTPISTVKPMTPPALDHAIRRSLAKEVERRWQSAGDLAGELQWITEAGSQAGVPAPLVSHRKVRDRLAWSVAAVLAVGLAPVAFLHFREIPPAPAAPVRFQIPAPENTTSAFLTLSPDGRKLAFIAGGRLWVHFLESGESRDLTAADGITLLVPGQSLHRISIPRKAQEDRGDWRSLTDRGGLAWRPFGRWRLEPGRRDRLRRPADRLIPCACFRRCSRSNHRTGSRAPGNRPFRSLFLAGWAAFCLHSCSTDEGKSAIYLGSVDAKPEQQSSKPLVASNWQPVYAPSADPSTGYLLFVREGTLMAQPFDNRRLELKGQARP